MYNNKNWIWYNISDMFHSSLQKAFGAKHRRAAIMDKN